MKKRPVGTWNSSSVHGILANEAYAGFWTYSKQKRVNGKLVKNGDNELVPVEIPAIVTHKLWDDAHVRLAHNAAHYRRTPKFPYLMTQRLVCGDCGCSLSGTACHRSKKSDQYNLYYRCTGTRHYVGRDCSMRVFFRADEVDAIVWQWISSLLTDPAALGEGFETFRIQQVEAQRPLLERLAIVREILAAHTTELERLLDLYLSGDFPKAMLADRKARLEQTISSLEKERSHLIASLQATTLREDQSLQIQGFLTEVVDGLRNADDSFELDDGLSRSWTCKGRWRSKKGAR